MTAKQLFDYAAKKVTEEQARCLLEGVVFKAGAKEIGYVDGVLVDQDGAETSVSIAELSTVCVPDLESDDQEPESDDQESLEPENDSLNLRQGDRI